MYKLSLRASNGNLDYLISEHVDVKNITEVVDSFMSLNSRSTRWAIDEILDGRYDIEVGDFESRFIKGTGWEVVPKIGLVV